MIMLTSTVSDDREDEGDHQAAGHEADLRPLARPLGEEEHRLPVIDAVGAAVLLPVGPVGVVGLAAAGLGQAREMK